MKTVMAFGTFDYLHPGHLSYLKQARELGDKLIVVIARDVNVERIKRKTPKQNENIRLNRLKELGIVDEAVLGRIDDKFKVVEEKRPDIIALGYDQQVDIKKLEKCFKGKIVRLQAYQPEKYKSSYYKYTN